MYFAELCTHMATFGNIQHLSMRMASISENSQQDSEGVQFLKRQPFPELFEINTSYGFCWIPCPWIKFQ